MLSIEYDLVGTGWSTCVVRDDDKWVELTASYLSDALGNLAATAVILAQGADEARFSFDEEPGEYRWVIHGRGRDVRVRILAFKKLWGNEPDEVGEEVFATTCDRMVFGRAVLRALERVLEKFGSEGYKEKWVDADFPHREFAELEELVGT